MQKSRQRTLLGVAATVALGAMVVGCTPSEGGTSQLIVGSWGGDFDNITKEHVVTAFNESIGSDAPAVVFDASSVGTRQTKIVAQAGSAKGDFDVILAIDWEVERYVAEGALEKLDYGKMPNASNIIPALAHEYCIPQMYSALALVYNPDKVDTVPTKWADLWSDEFKDSVGVYSAANNWFFWVAAAAAAGGDPGSDIEAGYPLIEQAAQQVRPYTSNEQLGQALISGEVPIAQSYVSRAAQWNAGGGNLKAIIPEEGTAASTFWACIPANSSNKEDAYELLNSFLEPSAQAAFAAGMGYAPTVTNAVLDADLQERIALSPEESERLWAADVNYLGVHFNDHTEMWNRDVVAK